MRALIQRVSQAQVNLPDENNRETAKIGSGLLILLGVGHNDGPEQIQILTNKIANLRIFEDENGKMNLSALDIQAEIIIVSQFTLYADCRKGRRPSFTGAAAPDLANRLYEEFANALKNMGFVVGRGVFAANMAVSLTNDGPVTIMLDTDYL